MFALSVAGVNSWSVASMCNSMQEHVKVACMQQQHAAM